MTNQLSKHEIIEQFSRYPLQYSMKYNGFFIFRTKDNFSNSLSLFIKHEKYETCNLNPGLLFLNDFPLNEINSMVFLVLNKSLEILYEDQ